MSHPETTPDHDLRWLGELLSTASVRVESVRRDGDNLDIELDAQQHMRFDLSSPDVRDHVARVLGKLPPPKREDSPGWNAGMFWNPSYNYGPFE